MDKCKKTKIMYDVLKQLEEELFQPKEIYENNRDKISKHTITDTYAIDDDQLNDILLQMNNLGLVSHVIRIPDKPYPHINSSFITLTINGLYMIEKIDGKITKTSEMIKNILNMILEDNVQAVNSFNCREHTLLGILRIIKDNNLVKGIKIFTCSNGIVTGFKLNNPCVTTEWEKFLNRVN